MSNPITKKTADERTRAGDGRPANSARQRTMPQYQEAPAAGAHAAEHLLNEDATPGAGALPSSAHRAGKEVDGGAG